MKMRQTLEAPHLASSRNFANRNLDMDGKPMNKQLARAITVSVIAAVIMGLLVIATWSQPRPLHASEHNAEEKELVYKLITIILAADLCHEEETLNSEEAQKLERLYANWESLLSEEEMNRVLRKLYTFFLPTPVPITPDDDNAYSLCMAAIKYKHELLNDDPL